MLTHIVTIDQRRRTFYQKNNVPLFLSKPSSCRVKGELKDLRFLRCPTPVLCVLRDLHTTMDTDSLVVRQPRSFYRKRNKATKKNLIRKDKPGYTPLPLETKSRCLSRNADLSKDSITERYSAFSCKNNSCEFQSY